VVLVGVEGLQIHPYGTSPGAAVARTLGSAAAEGRLRPIERSARRTGGDHVRVIQSILAAAVAAVALSASAQPADAALASNVDYGTGHYVDCSPDHQAGVHGQYGAWGSYVGGCTTAR
jgi:hypothetical protein